MRSAILLMLILVTTARAQITHYTVRLTPDLDHHLLRGEETIEFHHAAGDIEWQKQSGLQITHTKLTDGESSLADQVLSIRLPRGGKHVVRFEYTAAPARGITWFAKEPGFDTAFNCAAWMVCDTS